MIQNNLTYQREKCLRKYVDNNKNKITNTNDDNNNSNNNTGLNHGSAENGTKMTTRGNFLYAVRDDGSTLGEELWKQRRQSGKSYEFMVVDNSSQQQPSRISLSSIRSMIQAMGTELLPTPTTITTTTSIMPPPPQAQSQPQALAQAKPLKIPEVSLSTTHPTTSLMLLSSPHNNLSSSVYSLKTNWTGLQNQQNYNNSEHQHRYQSGSLPNVRCESSTKHDQVGTSSINYNQSNTTVTRHVDQEIHHHDPYVAAVAADDDDDDDDDDDFDDSILVNFDVDQAVSQHRQSSGSTTSSSSNNNNSCKRSHAIGNASIQSNHVSYTMNQIQPTSGGSSSFVSQPTQPRVPFNYDEDSHDSWGTHFNNVNDPSFTVHQYHSRTSNTIQSMEYYNSNNNNHHDQAGNDHPRQPSPPQLDNSNVPRCDGHNLPTRLLTASTSANMGRQFYKCALPEGENCGFFQWQDGIEGNYCNNNYNDGNPSAGGTGLVSSFVARGDIRDMLEANRRVFGHQSFRKGQREVIEKAMEGRDVFVLMPTGYVQNATKK
jgi:hypothetical protein